MCSTDEELGFASTSTDTYFPNEVENDIMSVADTDEDSLDGYHTSIAFQLACPDLAHFVQNDDIPISLYFPIPLCHFKVVAMKSNRMNPMCAHIAQFNVRLPAGVEVTQFMASHVGLTYRQFRTCFKLYLGGSLVTTPIHAILLHNRSLVIIRYRWSMMDATPLPR